MENDSNSAPRAPAAAPPEPAFVVESVLTEELYTRFNRVHIKAAGLLYPLLAICIILGVLSGVSLYAYLAFPNEKAEFPFVVVVFAALLVLLIVLYVFAPKICTKQYLKSARGIENAPFTVCLYGDRLVEYTPRGQTCTPYNTIYRVLETSDLLLIYISKMEAHILDKSGFRKGTPEALTAYLRGTWHVPYKQVK